MYITRAPIVLCLLFLSCKEKQHPEFPKDFRAKVIAVKDGDTIDVLYDGNTVAIRFAHIDCPEIKKRQPFGQAAKKFTADICFGQMVSVENEGKFDRYKRLIAVVFNNKNQNVNKELVSAGLAWHFAKYSSDTSYDGLEAIARRNKNGLWADESPTPPWNWRTP